ncbi:MAG: redox-sensing transcriptional repressor Rex [Eubacteriales bacterium]
MNEINTETEKITIQALQRMPGYLHYLKKIQKEGVAVIASPAIANEFKLNEVQVRKDLAAVSIKKGKPRTGFMVDELISDIEALLGYNNVDNAVLVGTGLLGKALLLYKGFEYYGINIIAAFDSDPNIIGSEIGDKKVLDVEKLSELCRRMNIHIGIITVPAEHAQLVCDKLVAGGILAIWNFAPAHLSVPSNILVQDENVAVSLAMLSKHLKDKMSK